MNQLDQQRQETLLNLFEHDGWKIVISELKENIEYLKNNAHYLCETNDQWQQHRGQLAANENFAAFENVTKTIAELDARDIEENDEL